MRYAWVCVGLSILFFGEAIHCAGRIYPEHAYYDARTTIYQYNRTPDGKGYDLKSPKFDSAGEKVVKPSALRLKDQYYYVVLESNYEDSLENIKKKYRELVLMYHPDKYASEGEKKTATAILQIIVNAFDMIANATRVKPKDYKAKELFWNPNKMDRDELIRIEKKSSGGEVLWKKIEKWNPLSGKKEQVDVPDFEFKKTPGQFHDHVGLLDVRPVSRLEVFYSDPPALNVRPDIRVLKAELLAASKKRVDAEGLAVELKTKHEGAVDKTLEDFKNGIGEESFEKLLTFMDSNLDMVYKPENIEKYRLLFETGLKKLNSKYLTETNINLLNQLNAFYKKCQDKGVFKEYWPNRLDYISGWANIVANLHRKIADLAAAVPGSEAGKASIAEQENKTDSLQQPLIDLNKYLQELKTKLDALQSNLVALSKAFTGGGVGID